MVSGKRAIATLLSGSPDNAEKYTRLLHSFVYSLRNAGYDEEIVVLYADDFPIDAEKLGQVLNVRTKAVQKITVQHTDGKGNPHYASMLTKLHLWDLVEYSQLMYYDCDFVFQKNPASAFSECSWSSLCATPDTGMHQFNKAIRPGTYFNAGFLVLRPSKATYAELMSKQHLAMNKFFVEQDLLNEVYKGKWGMLDQKYNLMHCYQLQAIQSSVVAIHEKMWVLRKSFPEQHYIWNSSKMRVNYPITNLLTLPKIDNQKRKGNDKKAAAPRPSAQMWLNAKYPPKQKLIIEGNAQGSAQGEEGGNYKPESADPKEAAAVQPSVSGPLLHANDAAAVINAGLIDTNKLADKHQSVVQLQLKDKKLFHFERKDKESRTAEQLRAFQERAKLLLPPHIAGNSKAPRNIKMTHKSVAAYSKRPKLIRNGKSREWV